MLEQFANAYDINYMNKKDKGVGGLGYIEHITHIRLTLHLPIE